MVVLPKLLYINILSFLLHLFFVIWDNGTLGQVGQVVQFCKEFYSLFPLSLAISLRSTLTISLVVIAILFSRTGKELWRIQLVGECIAVKKSLQNCPTCPIVPLSQQEMVFLSKLLYINILSFLLHLFFVIWDNGTLGQVGQVVQFCKEFYSLFPLSLAISLRSTLTISLVIIAILFSRTGKKLCRIQLVRDV